MTGNEAIAYVRDILKDNESLTKHGQFWDNKTIGIFLNVAQNCFIHSALSGNLYSLLDTLIETKEFDEIDLNTLDKKYLHYVSAIITGNPTRLVRLYTGNEAIAYKYCKHDCCIIYNNIATFYKKGVKSQGKLYYYRYPKKIIADDNPMMDFVDDIYRGCICKHAATLLGMKETNNQRDYKNSRQDKLYTKLVPAELVHKFGDIDLNLFAKAKQ